MNLEFFVKAYLIVGATLAAAKLSENQVSNSVAVLIGITWPLYVWNFVCTVLAKIRERPR